MTLHWTDYPLQPTKLPNGSVVQRSWSALFDESGTVCGRVRNTSSDDYEAYVGRPGQLLDIYGTEEEAKEAVAGFLESATKQPQ